MLDIAYRSVPSTVHSFEDRVLVDEKRQLFAVADGVTISSQGNGGMAAELALKVLEECFTGNVALAITNVHETILKRKNDDKRIGETTLTVAAISDDCLGVGNVGDSPAVLVRPGGIRFLTSEDRNSLGLITQVIGYPKTIVVHGATTKINDGDIVLLASDGVKHVLEQSRLQRITQESNADNIAEAIIRAAIAQRVPYDDDKSVVVLRLPSRD